MNANKVSDKVSDSVVSNADITKADISNADIYSYKLLPLKTLLGVVLLQAFSHAGYLPLWLSLFSTFVVVYRFVSFKRYRKPVSKFTKNILFIASTLAFVYHFKLNINVEMAASFLFLMAVLKLVEIQSRKDVITANYTLIFLIATSFLFDQGMLHTAIQFFCVFLCLGVLLRMNIGLDFRYVRTVRAQIRNTMLKALAVSIPIFVMCFLFFPRLPPLWSMPLDVGSSKTGFGATISPGDISSLAQSGDVAFRSKFSGKTFPSASSLYWKGAVLEEFDGREWRENSASEINRPSDAVDSARGTQTTEYEVILEPHQDDWAFVLDGSFSPSQNLRLKNNGVYKLKTDANQAVRYKASVDTLSLSGENVALMPLNTRFDNSYLAQRRNLQLPARHLNPLTQAFVNKLVVSGLDDEQTLNTILAMFRDQPFFYTLEPPKLGINTVDDFIFNTRKGFCEHYSNALAYMLRLAKIPSRVIVGYQGGERNANSDYLIIRQYDAHAWVEVFLRKHGWVRVDPTAMVAPNRIRLGLSEVMGNSEGFLKNSPIASMLMKNEFFKWAQLALDEVRYGWQNLVVNYNQDEQAGFLSGLLGEYSPLGALLVLVYFLIGVILIIGAYMIFVRHVRGRTRVEIEYSFVMLFVAIFGFKRETGETPRNFLRRVGSDMPVWMNKIVQNASSRLEISSYKE